MIHSNTKITSKHQAIYQRAHLTSLWVLQGRGWSTGSAGKLRDCTSPKVCPTTLMWIGHPIHCLPPPPHPQKNPSCLELTDERAQDPPAFPLWWEHPVERQRKQGPTPEKGLFISLQSGAPGAQSSQSGKSTYTALMPVTCREVALISWTLSPQESQGSGWPIWCMQAAIRRASLWFLPHLHPARLSLTPLCD